MKELTFDTMIAVFEEVFGFYLFWGMTAAAILIGLAFLWIVIRDRRLESARFVRAELLAPVGAIVAILFVQWVTSSGFSDVGGPIDVIVLIAIAVLGAVGITILGYVVQGIARPSAR